VEGIELDDWTSEPPTLIQDNDFVKLDCFFGLAEETSEPLSFTKANSHPRWREAKEHEKAFLLKNKPWEVYGILGGVQSVTTKWIYKINIEWDGKPLKLKVHLVA
jgi:hypothetical protein